jgi:hypothetical protein
MTLVQSPGALDWHPHAIHFIEHDPQRANGALEHRGEGDINGEVFPYEFATGGSRFETALR